jgi:hypothetical protein
MVPVPHDHAPVWCPYTGDLTNHSWTNHTSGQVYEKKHPLDLTEDDEAFFEGFYEIIETEGLTFGEGEAWCLDTNPWCPNTNKKICIKKTDFASVWNPFFQRYDPPCDRRTDKCCPNRIKYHFGNASMNELFHSYFSLDMDIFYDVYCECCRCDNCSGIHFDIWQCESKSWEGLKSRV